MEKRRLGRSDIELSTIGLGTLAISGPGWLSSMGDQDDSLSIQTIERAVASGIDWMHLAPIYAAGHATEVVARALKRISASDRPAMVVSIFGRWDENDPDKPIRDLTPQSIRVQVEHVLAALGVERLDVVQFHHQDHAVPIEESWGALAELMDEGKVGANGLSNHPVELLDRAETVRHVDSIQPPLSMLDRAAAADLLPWCVEHATGAVVYGPMQHGLLTGAFTRERVEGLEASGDRLRARLNWFNEPELSRSLQLVELLRPVAKRHDTSLAALAVAWALAWPGVTGAIVGARRPEQLAGPIAATELHLTEADLDEIAQALDRTGAGGDIERDTGDPAITDRVGSERPTRPPRGTTGR